MKEFIGRFRGGAEGAPAPLFSCVFKMFYDFALKIRFIKCSFILSSKTLTLLYFAHNAVSCMS